MTSVKNSFESPASGTTLSAGSGANADGSVAWSSITKASDGILKTDNGDAAHGSQSLLAGSGATAAMAYALFDNTVPPFSGSPSTLWGRFYCKFAANPASGFPMIQLVDHFSNLISRVTINTSGKVVLNYGASNTIAQTSTNAIVLNAWNRIEFKTVASTTAGQVEFQLFTTPESLTPVEAPAPSTGLVMPVAVIEGGRVGFCAATANLGPNRIDSVLFSDSGYPGPDLDFDPTRSAAFFAA